MPSRSPAIFWLLLAATLSVDAVVIDRSLADVSATLSLIFYALGFAQLSVLTIWAILLPPTVQLRWVVPLIGGVVVALLFVGPTQSWDEPVVFLVVLVLMWSHVIVCGGLLWLFKPTRWLMQWAPLTAGPKWQFGTAHLLTLITVVAVVSVLLRHADVLLQQGATVATLLIGNGVLLLATLVGRAKLLHWPIRLAASFGVALLIGVVFQLRLDPVTNFEFFAHNLVQAAIVWSWAEILFPLQVPAAGGEECPSPPATPT